MVCNKALERALFVLGLVERAKNRNKTKNIYIYCYLFVIRLRATATSPTTVTTHRKYMRIWAKSLIVLYANENSVLCIYFSI